ncbi:MAG: hypothetical protein WDO56_05885 [Gammaproteobacteria bacterium]
MMLASVLSILASGAIVFVLARRDPKRLRSVAHEADFAIAAPAALTARSRRALGWSVTIPGVALAVLGDWWAFLIWFGVTCALGWIAAQAIGYHARRG